MKPGFLKAFPRTIIFPSLSIGFCNRRLNDAGGTWRRSGSSTLLPQFRLVADSENKEIARLVALPETQELITCMRHRHKKDELAVLDAAYWVKGCSSLGRLRYAVLIGIGKYPNFGKFCLVDIKEAVVAAAPRYTKSSMPRDNAKRVVEGARNLSPFLGERMLAARFLDRSVVIRELLPQDLKLEMDRLTQEEAVAAAHLLAAVVGKARAPNGSINPA
jgi:uncharacterized protein (DUF2252 family)